MRIIYKRTMKNKLIKKHHFFKSINLLFLLMIITSCETNEPDFLKPLVISETTSEDVEVDYTTIKLKGNVSSDGGSEVIARGFCWSINPNPTIEDNTTTENIDTFTSIITDLVANTTYYFRAYATNSIGTGYATEQSFKTSSLNMTTWDFLLMHSATVSWHADVLFKDDGTTVYDEPDYPNEYTTYGTWSLKGNVLTYDLNSSSSANVYQFTGTLLGNEMSGTYTFGTEDDKSWNATKY